MDGGRACAQEAGGAGGCGARRGWAWCARAAWLREVAVGGAAMDNVMSTAAAPEYVRVHMRGAWRRSRDALTRKARARVGRCECLRCKGFWDPRNTARLGFCKLRLQHAVQKAWLEDPPHPSMQLRGGSRWARCSEKGDGGYRTIRCWLKDPGPGFLHELHRRVIMYTHAHNLVLAMCKELYALWSRKEAPAPLDLGSKGRFWLGMYFAVAMRYHLQTQKLPEFTPDQLQELQALFADNPHQKAILQVDVSQVEDAKKTRFYDHVDGAKFMGILNGFNLNGLGDRTWEEAKKGLNTYQLKMEMVAQAVRIFMPELALPQGEPNKRPPRSWEEFYQRDYAVMLRYHVNTLWKLKTIHEKHPAKYVDPTTSDQKEPILLPVGFGNMYLNGAQRSETRIKRKKRRWNSTIQGDKRTHTRTHAHTYTHTRRPRVCGRGEERNARADHVLGLAVVQCVSLAAKSRSPGGQILPSTTSS